MSDLVINRIEEELIQFKSKNIIDQSFKNHFNEWAKVSHIGRYIEGPSFKMETQAIVEHQEVIPIAPEILIDPVAIYPISDRMTLTLRFDSATEFPIPGIIIELYKQKTFKDNLYKSAKTDSNGQVTFTDLIPEKTYYAVIRDTNLAQNTHFMIKACDEYSAYLALFLEKKWQKQHPLWQKKSINDPMIHLIAKGLYHGLFSFWIHADQAHQICTGNPEEIHQLYIKAAPVLGDVNINLEQYFSEAESNKANIHLIFAFYHDETSLYLFVRYIMLNIRMLHPTEKHFEPLLSMEHHLVVKVVIDLLNGLTIGSLLSLYSATLGKIYFAAQLRLHTSQEQAKKLYPLFLPLFTEAIKLIQTFFNRVKTTNMQRMLYAWSPVSKNSILLLKPHHYTMIHNQQRHIATQQASYTHNQKNHLGLQQTPIIGHVSMRSGEGILINHDAQFNGIPCFDLTRIYRTSGVNYASGFGAGWSHSLMHHVEFKDDLLIWFDHEQNHTPIPIPDPHVGVASNSIAQANAMLSPEGDFLLSSPCTKGLYVHVRRSGNTGVVSAFSDSYGNRLNVQYQAGQPHRLLHPEGISWRFVTVDVPIEPEKEQTSSHPKKSFKAKNKTKANKALPTVNRIQALVLEKYYLDEEKQLHYETLQSLRRYEYDNKGRLSGVIYPNGQRESYTYDEHHVLRTHTSIYQNTLHWQWRHNGVNSQAVQHWDDAQQIEYKYAWSIDGNGTVTDKTGASQAFNYNDNAQITRYLSAAGTTSYEYADHGELHSSTQGDETHYYFYNSHLNLEMECLADGTQINYRYHDGRIVQKNTNDREKWQFSYDFAGKLISQTDPLGHKTQYQWNEKGLLTKIIHPDQSTEQFGWNHFGQLADQAGINGATTRFTYNVIGNIVEVAQGKGKVTTFEWYQGDTLMKVGQLHRSSYYYHFDAEDRLKNEIDPFENITTYTYLPKCRYPHRIIRADQSVIDYEYDTTETMRITKITNQQQEVTQLSYHPNGFIQAVERCDGVRTEYHYDAQNLIIEKIEHNPLSNQTYLHVYRRDPCGRILSIKSPLNRLVQYCYDRQGRIITIQEENSDYPLGYQYDEKGRCITEHQNWFSLYYTYDALDRLQTMKLPSGHIIEYHYKNGHIQHICVNNVKIIECEYRYGQAYKHSLGRVLQQMMTYDERGYLTQQRVKFSQEHEAFIVRDYTYDLAGRLSRYHDRTKGEKHYHYDALGRLEVAHQIGKDLHLPDHHQNLYDFSEQFYYDYADNLKGSNCSEFDLAERITIQQQRMTAHLEMCYEYDVWGNMIKEYKRDQTEWSRHYVYNDLHQLIRFTDEHMHSFIYAYDDLGRRVKKIDLHTNQTTYFVWQDHRLITEWHEDQETTHYRHYIYMPDCETPAALLMQVGSKIQCFYFIHDHLGTPLEIISHKGEVVWSAIYRAYGHVSLLLTNQIKNAVRFQGHYFDEESGLYYNHQRYYHPTLGRFLTPDSNFASTINLQQWHQFNHLYQPNPYQALIDPINWRNPYGSIAVPAPYLEYHQTQIQPPQVTKNLDWARYVQAKHIALIYPLKGFDYQHQPQALYQTTLPQLPQHPMVFDVQYHQANIRLMLKIKENFEIDLENQLGIVEY